MAIASVQVVLSVEDVAYTHHTSERPDLGALHLGRYAQVALMVNSPDVARRLAEHLDALATAMEANR